MPANYVVVEAEKTADKPDRGFGPMQTIRLKLRNEQGQERAGISWYAKATTPVPAAGVQLFGDVTKTDYGWQFKKAQQGGHNGRSGAGRDYKADPVKQAAIACEAAHKAAIDLTRLELEFQGKIDPQDLDRIVTARADWMLARIVKAMGEAR